MSNQIQFISKAVQRVAKLGLVCLLAAIVTHTAQAQRYKGLHSGVLGHLTFEGGGGVTAPISSTQNYANTGWNMLLGGGWRFNKRFDLLAEWQFNRMGVPNDLAFTQSNGQAVGGNEHIWTAGVDGKYNYVAHSILNAYVLGGGGFSRQLTTFTAGVLVPCGYSGYSGFSGFGGYSGFGGSCVGNVNVSHESSNQGALNVGTGLEWRLSPYERYKIFLEARYLKTYSPQRSILPPGQTTPVILPPGYYAQFFPVTLGLRW